MSNRGRVHRFTDHSKLLAIIHFKFKTGVEEKIRVPQPFLTSAMNPEKRRLENKKALDIIKRSYHFLRNLKSGA